jgi:hypothetical protein
MADNEIPDERQLAYKTQYTKKAKRNITWQNVDRNWQGDDWEL